MTNEALIETVVRGDVPALQKSIIPNVTSYDFTTNPNRPTVTNGGSGTHTFYKWQTKVTIRDDVSKAEVANSGDPFTGIPCTTAVVFTSSLRACYHRWVQDNSITDAQINTALGDSAFAKFFNSLVVSDISHIKYQADQVSTALDAWDATVRDRIKQMCDDFLGN